MQLVVDGTKIFVGTGGREFDPALPTIVFLHGAGLDHTVWALLARWFAHRGFGALAPDLPGHGRSEGKPLETIAAMADFTAALMEAAGARRTRIVGHSMGSLIALETAVRHPDHIEAIGLIATAAAMTVSPDLLAAALPNARVVVLAGAGHMLMSERPDEVLAALRDLAAGAGVTSASVQAG